MIDDVAPTDGKDQHKNSTPDEPDRLARVPARLRQHCFPPGRSGNPRGRPRGSGVYRRIEESMRRYADLEPRDRRQIIRALLDQLHSGKTPAALGVAIARFLIHCSVTIIEVEQALVLGRRPRSPP
jgi:hypothetical protein